MKNEKMDFDLSDTPQEKLPKKDPKRPPPHPVRMKKEDGGQQQARRRMPNQTMPQIPAMPGQGMQPVGQAPAAQPGSWDVTVPGKGVYRVPGVSSAEQAKQAIVTWFAEDQDDPSQAVNLNPRQLIAKPVQEMTAGGAGTFGYQKPITDEQMQEIKERVNTVFKEIIRKKKNGGGYVLYKPNKGKRGAPKKVGEFPTRKAAKDAEINRFPPKDPKKAARAKARAAKAESVIQALTNGLTEALFREEDIPGSAWDERLAALGPKAMASDKKLHGHHRSIEKASIGALGDGHKALAKALKRHGKVLAGEHGRETGGKMYMPVSLETKGAEGTEIGPIHLYIDGGHVKMELSDEFRQGLATLDPKLAHEIRGALMTFEEEQLPRIDGARKAVGQRDAYLDKLEKALDGQLSGMSGVELHLAKNLIGQKHGRRFR